MRKTNILAIAMSVIVLASCSTSSDVVDGGLFQKRKYNKGFHFNKKVKVNEGKGTAENHKNEIVFTPLEVEVSEDVLISSDLKTLNTEVQEINSSSELVQHSSHSVTTNEVKKTSRLRTKSFLPIATEGMRNQVIEKVINKDLFKSEISQTSSDVELLILVILALLLPPLAVGIFEGITSRFWITLILWLLGWGVGIYILGVSGGLFSLLAVIYALLIVLGAI